MQGTIITPAKNHTVELAAAGRIYQAKLSPDLGTVKPGDEVLFQEISPAGWFKKGRAQITDVKPFDLSTLPSAVSLDRSVPAHQLVEQDSSYRLAAEGSSFADCYQRLAAAAIKYEANALLQLETSYIKRPFARTLLCRVTASPAQITGPVYQPKPGLHMKLPVKYSRRNSPSSAQLRYIRVLLVCLLLIAEPCLARLSAREVIPLLYGQILMAALPIFCLIYAVLCNPVKRAVYILRTKH